jgi:hypothetical protein
MNGYEAEEFRSFVPPGWDRWYAAASALMKKQFNNNGTIVSARSRTFDQKVAGKGLNFVESQAPSNTPFMAAFNFYAPHYPAENFASLDELYQEVELPPDPPSRRPTSRISPSSYRRSIALIPRGVRPSPSFTGTGYARSRT